MSDTGAPNGYQKLPPGWDCKYDQTTGNCYYINYLTKAMQLEDPRAGRNSYKQLQNERCSTESIPLQHMAQSSHHSSPYHVVHPSNNLTAVRAFQERERGQQPALHNLSTSPLLSASSRAQLEMSSPLPLQRARLASNMSRRSTIQETSFSHQSESQAVVTKIQNMFPTADENHIRLLLKRYMKNIFPKADEMLLLDILANADNNVQFASEKLISLGYAKRDMQQPHRPNNRPPHLDADQKSGNEQGVQHIPLRPKEYTAEQKTDMEALLKERYPQIAERIILMALESVNYAEDRAMQILQIVQDEDEQRSQKHALPKSSGTDSALTLPVDQVDAAATHSRCSSSNSKPNKLHRHLPSINVITPTAATTQIILSHSATPTPESEPKAANISGASTHSYASPAQTPYERLTTKNMLARSGCCNNNNNNDNSSSNSSSSNNNNSNASSYSSIGSSTASAGSIAKAFESRARTKTDSLKQRQHSAHLDNGHNLDADEFQSLIARMATLGPNAQLAKGADEKLLLADYVTWNGPNTTLSPKQAAQGADPGLLAGERGYKPAGRNPELCKGAKKELAKGSIYAQGKSANIKCN
ncbi:rho GTPase-activating protein gacK isoform X3 [Drosophila virilis]|uniref:Uncharacterized protein, isoform B n=1 Tax=Drosophila virilis TaxID=7244 RepID=A0A0Q9WK64_DROVI|nr:serine/threonine-protein kinase pakG isoform X4 [Drosophila virilis]KRF85016.1 uncharacterized protein Dvir_GJ13878, isoform B [Drosophila virilis]